MRARSGNRRAVAVSLLAFAPVFSGGCARERPADTLTLAVRAGVTGFFPNPPVINEGFTSAINEHVYEGLVRRGRGGGIEPALAETWNETAHNTTVFTLRPGLRFSDGSRVTAADVVASMSAMSRLGWINHESLQLVESVRALGDTRVELRTRRSDLLMLSRLQSVFVLPAAAVSRTPVPVVGTGPYQLEAWAPGKEFTLARNPHYRGPAPAFARAHFLVEPDAGRRLGHVLEGRADVADHVPLEAAAELERRADLRVSSGSGSRVLFLRLREHQRPFDDPRVRRALDLALDRSEIVARVFHGRAQAASQIVPRSIVGYDPGIPVTRPDREAARLLLADAGYPSGLDLRLDGPSNRYEMDLPLMHELARQLAEVGVRVQVSAVDKTSFFAMVDEGRTSFFLAGWESETGEAGNALDGLFHTQRTPAPGSAAPRRDAELDRLIEASHGAETAQARTELLQAAVRRVAELQVVLPLVVQPVTLVVSRRMVWEPPADFRLRLQDFTPAR
jgi:peptide/nickel transport system substrate-binding protein